MVKKKREEAGVQGQAARPDTGLLYSVDDVARLARVDRVVVVRLCLAKLMPAWIDVDGKRYWDRVSAVEAVALCARARMLEEMRGRRKSA